MPKDYVQVRKITELINSEYSTDGELLNMGFSAVDIEEARVRAWLKNEKPKRCPKCNKLAFQFVTERKCFACYSIERHEFEVYRKRIERIERRDNAVA